MTLKKYFIAFVAAFFMLPVNCHASVPDSEVSLGGIYYGASMQYVQDVYGRPDKRSVTYEHALWRGEVATWKYGDSIVVIFSDKKVIHVGISANNGFATPAGVIVGMPYTVPQRLYGTPDLHASTYMFYHVSDSEYRGVRFSLKNGVITTIDIGEFD